MTGVISNKLTLLEYLPQARKTPTHFYNKVMQYLLERIGECIAAFRLNPNQVRILVEARAQQYSSLLSFIEAIQKNPLDPRATAIRNVDRFSISAIKKMDEPCMAISDMGAHALFSAVRRDHRSFGLSETRYLNELSPVFVCGKNGQIVPNGIKLIHSIEDAQLPKDTAEFFRYLKNPNREFHRYGT